MATWNTTSTSTDESPQPTKWQKFLDGVKTWWGRFILFLVLIFLAWLFFLGMSMLSDLEYEIVSITPAELEQEDRDAPVSQEDQELWSYLMRIVNGMSHGDFVLNGEAGKAEEFGRAYFPDSRAIVVTEIVFHHAEKSVDVHYSLGVNKEIRLIYRNNNITKYLTRYEGFSEGVSFLRYLQWYTYGKYQRGYPRYTCSIDLTDGYIVGAPKAEKRVYKLRPFSKVREAVKYFLGKT